LKGLTATTHPYFYAEFREMCEVLTTVVEERYVVNKVSEKGLRVVTSGGVSCGLDACMWLINEVAGKQCAEEVLEVVQYSWRQGVVI
jgi:transcriptional regulator GlxA family with amidase domain